MSDGKAQCGRRSVDRKGANGSLSHPKTQIETMRANLCNDNIDDLAPFIKLLSAVFEAKTASESNSDPSAVKVTADRKRGD